MDEDVWMLEERLRLEGLNVYQDVLDPRASWLSRYRVLKFGRFPRPCRKRKSGSHATLRWREMDSNLQYAGTVHPLMGPVVPP